MARKETPSTDKRPKRRAEGQEKPRPEPEPRYPDKPRAEWAERVRYKKASPVGRAFRAAAEKLRGIGDRAKRRREKK